MDYSTVLYVLACVICLLAAWELPAAKYILCITSVGLAYIAGMLSWAI